MVVSVRRAGREIVAVLRGSSVTHAHLRDRLIAVVAVGIVLDLLGSVAMFYLERHAGRTEIHTIGDSAFFTTAQLLTVSSAMANPLTTGGRVLDLVLELYAISVVATLAGSFGAFFLRRGREREAEGLVAPEPGA